MAIGPIACRKAGQVSRALAAVCLALGLLVLLGACDEGDEPAAAVEDEKTMNYRIYKLERGQAVELGTVAFDSDNVATLTVTASGDDAAALERDWLTVSGLDRFRLKYEEETTDDDGHARLVIKDREVNREADDYPKCPDGLLRAPLRLYPLADGLNGGGNS